jgi:TolB-like protein/DNA-binding winged helix-turn-helix (wHTH) protein/tetratricopeptide (TPR) repeat protein
VLCPCRFAESIIRVRIAAISDFMTAAGRPPQTYRFGLFELDERQGDILKQGSRMRLRGRPYDILLILLNRPGELITREELRARLWSSDTFVDFDHGLNASVNRLRDVLGDSAESPRFIETIPRKGYRFMAPVTVTVSPQQRPSEIAQDATAIVTENAVTASVTVPAESLPEVSAAVPPTSRLRQLRVPLAIGTLVIATVAAAVWRLSGTHLDSAATMRLAVLPFRNVSGDPEQEFFSDGFTDEMISELGALEPSRLGVIARTTSMHYKGSQKNARDIGTELGVNYVLEGSVRREGDRVRINADLVETKGQTSLWSDTYDRKAADVIDIQKDVAMAIARSVVPTLSNRGALSVHTTPTPLATYEFTLKGRFFREQATEDSTRKAIEYFDRAIAIDPSYAPAYAAKGDAYRLLGAPGWEVEAPEALLKKARESAQRALTLDASSSDAHAAMAMVLFSYDWDLVAAEREIKEAIRLNPSSSKAHQYYSGILTGAERMDEATQEARRGAELDPLSATAGTTLGVRLYYSNRIDEAEAEFQKTLEVAPSFAVAHWGLAQCYRLKGRMEEQLDELTKAVTLSGNSAYMRAHLGYGYAAAGDRAHALAIAEELEAEGPRRYVAPYHLALIAAGLGDTAGAARWLDRAFRDRSGWIVFLSVEPEFRTIRQAPEVQRLLASVRR